jgi:glutaconate CoA-transferase subunit B
VTDLALWRPDPESGEFVVCSLHPGATRQKVQETCGWQVRFAAILDDTPAPTSLELETLRALHARTAARHGAPKVG